MTRHASKLVLSILLVGTLVSCRASADPHSPIVGKWNLVTDDSYGSEAAEFFPDGACRLAFHSTKILSCNWNLLPDSKVRIQYGLLLPINHIVGTVDGDQMILDYGEGTRTAWIRLGSPNERNTIAYFHGKSIIQSGDFKAGMAIWKQAADQGHQGAANSLAWILATSRDPQLRDGKLAVAYAERAVAGFHHYQYLDTLAAWLARDSQFERAVIVEQEALGLLQQDKALLPTRREAAEGRFRAKIALYQIRQPYTEPE